MAETTTRRFVRLSNRAEMSQKFVISTFLVSGKASVVYQPQLPDCGSELIAENLLPALQGVRFHP